MRGAVIDTCVIIDMMLTTRARHPQALLLRREIARVNVSVRLPMFAAFEINHAVRQEHRLSQGKVPANLPGEPDVPVTFVPIDDEFMKRYFDVNLPEMRAGDMVFAALAKGDSLPLITEDVPFARVARVAGIRVMSIVEYHKELASVAA